jgi:hypothetical protein
MAKAYRSASPDPQDAVLSLIGVLLIVLIVLAIVAVARRF